MPFHRKCIILKNVPSKLSNPVESYLLNENISTSKPNPRLCFNTSIKKKNGDNNGHGSATNRLYYIGRVCAQVLRNFVFHNKKLAVENISYGQIVTPKWSVLEDGLSPPIQTSKILISFHRRIHSERNWKNHICTPFKEENPIPYELKYQPVSVIYASLKERSCKEISPVLSKIKRFISSFRTSKRKSNTKTPQVWKNVPLSVRCRKFDIVPHRKPMRLRQMTVEKQKKRDKETKIKKVEKSNTEIKAPEQKSNITLLTPRPIYKCKARYKRTHLKQRRKIEKKVVNVVSTPLLNPDETNPEKIKHAAAVFRLLKTTKRLDTRLNKLIKKENINQTCVLNKVISSKKMKIRAQKSNLKKLSEPPLNEMRAVKKSHYHLHKKVSPNDKALTEQIKRLPKAVSVDKKALNYKKNLTTNLYLNKKEKVDNRDVLTSIFVKKPSSEKIARDLYHNLPKNNENYTVNAKDFAKKQDAKNIFLPTKTNYKTTVEQDNRSSDVKNSMESVSSVPKSKTETIKSRESTPTTTPPNRPKTEKNIYLTVYQSKIWQKKLENVGKPTRYEKTKKTNGKHKTMKCTGEPLIIPSISAVKIKTRVPSSVLKIKKTLPTVSVDLRTVVQRGDLPQSQTVYTVKHQPAQVKPDTKKDPIQAVNTFENTSSKTQKVNIAKAEENGPKKLDIEAKPNYKRELVPPPDRPDIVGRAKYLRPPPNRPDEKRNKEVEKQNPEKEPQNVSGKDVPETGKEKHVKTNQKFELPKNSLVSMGEEKKVAYKLDQTKLSNGNKKSISDTATGPEKASEAGTSTKKCDVFENSFIMTNLGGNYKTAVDEYSRSAVKISSTESVYSGPKFKTETIKSRESRPKTEKNVYFTVYQSKLLHKKLQNVGKPTRYEKTITKRTNGKHKTMKCTGEPLIVPSTSAVKTKNRVVSSVLKIKNTSPPVTADLRSVVQRGDLPQSETVHHVSHQPAQVKPDTKKDPIQAANTFENTSSKIQEAPVNIAKAEESGPKKLDIEAKPNYKTELVPPPDRPDVVGQSKHLRPAPNRPDEKRNKEVEEQKPEKEPLNVSGKDISETGKEKHVKTNQKFELPKNILVSKGEEKKVPYKLEQTKLSNGNKKSIVGTANIPEKASEAGTSAMKCDVFENSFLMTNLGENRRNLSLKTVTEKTQTIEGNHIDKTAKLSTIIITPEVIETDKILTKKPTECNTFSHGLVKFKKSVLALGLDHELLKTFEKYKADKSGEKLFHIEQFSDNLSLKTLPNLLEPTKNSKEIKINSVKNEKKLKEAPLNLMVDECDKTKTMPQFGSLNCKEKEIASDVKSSSIRSPLIGDHSANLISESSLLESPMNYKEINSITKREGRMQTKYNLDLNQRKGNIRSLSNGKTSSSFFGENKTIGLDKRESSISGKIRPVKRYDPRFPLRYEVNRIMTSSHFSAKSSKNIPKVKQLKRVPDRPDLGMKNVPVKRLKPPPDRPATPTHYLPRLPPPPNRPDEVRKLMNLKPSPQRPILKSTTFIAIKQEGHTFRRLSDDGVTKSREVCPNICEEAKVHNDNSNELEANEISLPCPILYSKNRVSTAIPECDRNAGNLSHPSPFLWPKQDIVSSERGFGRSMRNISSRHVDAEIKSAPQYETSRKLSGFIPRFPSPKGQVAGNKLRFTGTSSVICNSNKEKSTNSRVPSVKQPVLKSKSVKSQKDYHNLNQVNFTNNSSTQKYENLVEVYLKSSMASKEGNRESHSDRLKETPVKRVDYFQGSPLESSYNLSKDVLDSMETKSLTKPNEKLNFEVKTIALGEKPVWKTEKVNTLYLNKIETVKKGKSSEKPEFPVSPIGKCETIPNDIFTPVKLETNKCKPNTSSHSVTVSLNPFSNELEKGKEPPTIAGREQILKVFQEKNIPEGKKSDKMSSFSGLEMVKMGFSSSKKAANIFTKVFPIPREKGSIPLSDLPKESQYVTIKHSPTGEADLPVKCSETVSPRPINQVGSSPNVRRSYPPPRVPIDRRQHVKTTSLRRKEALSSPNPHKTRSQFPDSKPEKQISLLKKLTEAIATQPVAAASIKRQEKRERSPVSSTEESKKATFKTQKEKTAQTSRSPRASSPETVKSSPRSKTEIKVSPEAKEQPVIKKRGSLLETVFSPSRNVEIKKKKCVTPKDDKKNTVPYILQPVQVALLEKPFNNVLPTEPLVQRLPEEYAKKDKKVVAKKKGGPSSNLGPYPPIAPPSLEHIEVSPSPAEKAKARAKKEPKVELAEAEDRERRRRPACSPCPPFCPPPQVEPTAVVAGDAAPERPPRVRRATPFVVPGARQRPPPPPASPPQVPQLSVEAVPRSRAPPFIPICPPLCGPALSASAVCRPAVKPEETTTKPSLIEPNPPEFLYKKATENLLKKNSSKVLNTIASIISGMVCKPVGTAPESTPAKKSDGNKTGVQINEPSLSKVPDPVCEIVSRKIQDIVAAKPCGEKPKRETQKTLELSESLSEITGKARQEKNPDGKVDSCIPSNTFLITVKQIKKDKMKYTENEYKRSNLLPPRDPVLPKDVKLFHKSDFVVDLAPKNPEGSWYINNNPTRSDAAKSKPSVEKDFVPTVVAYYKEEEDADLVMEEEKKKMRIPPVVSVRLEDTWYTRQMTTPMKKIQLQKRKVSGLNAALSKKKRMPPRTLSCAVNRNRKPAKLYTLHKTGSRSNLKSKSFSKMRNPSQSFSEKLGDMLRE